MKANYKNLFSQVNYQYLITCENVKPEYFTGESVEIVFPHDFLFENSPIYTDLNGVNWIAVTGSRIIPELAKLRRELGNFSTKACTTGYYLEYKPVTSV